MRRVVLVPFCISQIPQQVHINSSPFQGPPNNEKKNPGTRRIITNYGISLRCPGCLLKFLDLEGGRKIEAGCLLNFHYFHKVVSLF